MIQEQIMLPDDTHYKCGLQIKKAQKHISQLINRIAKTMKNMKA